MVHVLIGGDLCPIGLNKLLFESGDAPALFGEFLSEFQKADLSVVNLECPLIAEEKPIEKIGPILGVPRKCVRGIKAVGIDVVNLGNNHIMDHGYQGLRSTIDTLEENDIAHVGVGENLDEARRILIRYVQGMAIGILSVAEHEFSIAAKNVPGANPLDVIDFVRTVQEHRSDWDRLIVLLHGGNEFYRYPSPRLKNTCHFMIEQGADAVICQHSHCCGCMETYKGAPIVYGQGNLLFDADHSWNMWYEGMLVSLEIDRGNSIQTRPVPFKQVSGRPGIHEMAEHEREAFFAGFEARSEIVRDDERLGQLWEQFCKENETGYLRSLYGHKSLVYRVLARMRLLDRFYTKRKRQLSLSAIQCESHREALLNILAEDTTEAKRADALPGATERKQLEAVRADIMC